MFCCTVSNATGEVPICRKPAGMGIAPGMQRLPQTGPVLSRGVEGKEEAGETTPVPEWGKELLGKKNPSGEPSKEPCDRMKEFRFLHWEEKTKGSAP